MNHSRKYVFLLSMPRSGSTLFTRLLNNIDQCVSLPETHFIVFYDENRSLSFPSDKEKIITNWIEFYRTKKWISNLNELSNKLIKEANSYQDIFDISVDQYLEENDINIGSYIIEKSPPHIFFQPDIKRLFHNSRAVYLIRDPRAVAGSMLGMSWSTHNIYTIARSWKKSTENFKKIDPHVIVRYEDIITKKESVIYDLELFFDQKIDSDKIFQLDKDISGMNSWYHRNLKKDVSEEFIYKWKNQLSTVDCETEIIEYVCADLMQKYGYEASATNIRTKMYLLLFLDISKLLVNKFFKK